MSSHNTTPLPPPMFNGTHYPIWMVKMTTYLKAADLWDYVGKGKEPLTLSNNPLTANIKQNLEESTKKYKALMSLQSAVSEPIFTRIMACDSPKEAWDKLKVEFQGSEKTRTQQVINLRRDFENLKMKEGETVKVYSYRIQSVVNNIRLLGVEFSDSRVVEKVITTLPEKYEAKISSLEDSKDLSTITLQELVNSMYAVEQRRANRIGEVVEGAFSAKEKGKAIGGVKGKKNQFEKKNKVRIEGSNNASSSSSSKETEKKQFPPCSHCKKTNHSKKFCWFKPDIKCRFCNQPGHMGRVCPSKKQQQGSQAQVIDLSPEHEEQVFVATCYASSSKMKKGWLIDSGCTHHMSSDKELFKTLDTSHCAKVRIGNGAVLATVGRGDATVQTSSGSKTITDVLFVPDLDQNLVSVGQLLERGYKLQFQDKICNIYEPLRTKLMTIEMLDRSFCLDWKSAEQNAFSTLVDNTVLWHQRLGHVSYIRWLSFKCKRWFEICQALLMLIRYVKHVSLGSRAGFHFHLDRPGELLKSCSWFTQTTMDQ